VPAPVVPSTTQRWLPVHRSGNVVQSFGAHWPVGPKQISGGVQVASVHASTHDDVALPLSTHCCALPPTGGHVTFAHGSTTHRFASHFFPAGHGNSPAPHGNAQRQSLPHAEPPVQVVGVVGVPLQSQHEVGSSGMPTHWT
jgi:hypothetical protein